MSSPEDLLNACATSQEERQRLISRANDALSLWDNWLHPFTSGSETGDDPAYDDNFQLMREEINKISGTDSALLCELAQKCLCECAKDIRVATWYVHARLIRDGEKGLAEGLLLLVAMLTRYGQACHPRRPAARKAALEWLNSAKVIDALLIWPEVDSNDAGLTAGAISLLESTVADWPETEKPSFAGLCTALENRLARSGGMEALVPQNSSAQEHGREPAHSDSPQLSAVKSGRDLLDQAKLLSRWLSEQPQGWLASHRLIKTVRWDTVDQIPPLDSSGRTRLVPPKPAQAVSLPPPATMREFNPETLTPWVTPVYAKSCLKEKGCTDAGTAEEPVDNFGQMTIFAQPVEDDCCGYGHQHEHADDEVVQHAQSAKKRKPDAGSEKAPAEASAAPLALGAAAGVMTQVWGEWSLTGALGAARGIPYVGAMVSALYIPSAGEGSGNVPGRDEFWYEEELRQKAITGAKATTRVRFFWHQDEQGNMRVYGVHTGEGTPYEGVRTAKMDWVKENNRYEFKPARGADVPLITWTPERPEGSDVPAHTGSDIKPIDQATILVTPIPDGKDEYTTPPFPVPDERDLNDYILVFPADSGIKPIYVYLKDDPRTQPGTASGTGTQIENGKNWLDLSVTNSGEGAKIPAHIADKLRGRNYTSFNGLREDIWIEISNDPELMAQFGEDNQERISGGLAPWVPSAGYYHGPNEVVKKFQIHHDKAIENGGGVYDIDNLRIVTPRLHDEIHYRR